MKRHPWKIARLWQCLTIAAFLILGCRSKDGRYFVPNPFGPPIEVTDLVPPTIENLRPATDIVLNDTRISFDAFDGPGEPMSGLDIARLRALYGTLPLPITRLGTGNTFEVDINSIGEGQRSINLEAFDFAGNRRTASYSFRTDWSGPTVTWNGAVTGSGTQQTITVNASGTYADPGGLAQTVYYIRQLANGQCTAAGALVPTGTEPGMVVQNTYPLGTNGLYDLNFTLNGPPNDQRPQTTSYCWHFHGEDLAKDRNGNARPNVTDRFWRLDFAWRAPQVQSVVVTPNNISLTVPATQQMTATVSADPGASTSVTWSATPATVGTIDQNGLVTTVGTGELDIQACSTIAPTVCGTARLLVLAPFNFAVSWSLVSWNHVAFAGGPSNTCGRGQAVVVQGNESGTPSATGMQAALVGSPYTVTWTGPGIVGSSTRNGTLDANGQFFDRQAIAAFGTYTVTVSVTSGGITRTSTGTTTVNSGAGSCPPP